MISRQEVFVRKTITVSVALLGITGATWAQGVSPVDLPTRIPMRA